MSYLAVLNSYVPSLGRVLNIFDTKREGGFGNLCSGLRVVCFLAETCKSFTGRIPAPALVQMYEKTVSLEPAITVISTLNDLNSEDLVKKFQKPNFKPAVNYKPFEGLSQVFNSLGVIGEAISFYNQFDFSSFSVVASRIGKIDAATNGFYCVSALVSLLGRNGADKSLRERMRLTPRAPSENDKKIHKIENYRDVALVLGTGLSLFLAYKENKYAALVSKVSLRAADCFNLLIAY